MNIMGIKLVIVDDAPFIREVMRNIFLHSSIEVVGEASNGIEALQVVKETLPDVVIMDIVMPQMNGVEAAEKLMQLFPQLKVIACSTMDQEFMMLKALEAGCCSFILKPFTANDLLNAVLAAQKMKKEITSS